MATPMARIAGVTLCVVVASCSSATPVAPSAEQLHQSVAVVRSTYCNGTATGSGFFIGDHELVTNRHVVADAEAVSVVTADNRVLAVDEVSVNSRTDAAVLHVQAVDAVPLSLGNDPAPGDEAWVVGFPHGGKVRVTTGRVVDEVDGRKYRAAGEVIRTRAEADPGNSGGPLLNYQGQVTGLVFAVEYSSGWTLAVPVSELEAALSTMHRAPVIQC